MKYWHINFEDENYWIEVNEYQVVLRQIVDSQHGRIQLSCFEDCLAEGRFDPLDMDGSVTEISELLFEERWESETQKHEHNWLKQKFLYTIGREIDGKILYFYPQGCIVKIGDAIGCIYALDNHCAIGDTIKCVIQGYDDKNMWIILSQE